VREWMCQHTTSVQGGGIHRGAAAAATLVMRGRATRYGPDSTDAPWRGLIFDARSVPQGCGQAHRHGRGWLYYTGVQVAPNRTLRYGRAAYPGLSRDEGSGCFFTTLTWPCKNGSIAWPKQTILPSTVTRSRLHMGSRSRCSFGFSPHDLPKWKHNLAAHGW
jgi:hypothetical protein